jgi:hypothetical protein
MLTPADIVKIKKIFYLPNCYRPDKNKGGYELVVSAVCSLWCHVTHYLSKGISDWHEILITFDGACKSWKAFRVVLWKIRGSTWVRCECGYTLFMLLKLFPPSAGSVFHEIASNSFQLWKIIGQNFMPIGHSLAEIMHGMTL